MTCKTCRSFGWTLDSGRPSLCPDCAALDDVSVAVDDFNQVRNLVADLLDAIDHSVNGRREITPQDIASAMFEVGVHRFFVDVPRRSPGGTP